MVGKIYESIDRVRVIINELAEDEQGVYQRDRRCVKEIFAIKQFWKKSGILKPQINYIIKLLRLIFKLRGI